MYKIESTNLIENCSMKWSFSPLHENKKNKITGNQPFLSAARQGVQIDSTFLLYSSEDAFSDLPEHGAFIYSSECLLTHPNLISCWE